MSTDFVSDGNGRINMVKVEWSKDDAGRWVMAKVLFVRLIGGVFVVIDRCPTASAFTPPMWC